MWGSAEARTHFQRYPVLWLTFKDIKDRTFDEAFESIQGEIRQMYREHDYLLDEGALRPEEAAWFQEILAGKGSEIHYYSALGDLSRLLARHHGERVVILIDEYDTPIHSISPGKEERRLIDFFGMFLSRGLKDNPHLFRGVLTGILRVAKESLFSGINNLVVYSLLSRECATSFGFTEAEVRDLAQKMGAEASIDELTRWYNGYRFGGEVIYNPWSILNFLASDDKALRPYWVHTSSEDLLRRVVLLNAREQSAEMETLLGGGEIEARVDDRVALRDLPSSPGAVWSFLLFTGYLKATAVRVDEMGDTIATLAVPNKEVQYAYRNLYRSWMEEQLGSDQLVDKLLQAVVSGDAPTCERILCELLQSLSVHDVAPRRAAKKGGSVPVAAAGDPDADTHVVLTPEQVYHVFVVTLLLGLQPRFVVRSNRESGGGRYDVMVMPRSPGQPGVVLELKVRSKSKRETVAGAMSTALRQLRERDYAAELRASGAEPIHELGIVFDGKRAWVEAASAKKPSTRRKPAAGQRKPTPRQRKPTPRQRKPASKR